MDVANSDCVLRGIWWGSVSRNRTPYSHGPRPYLWRKGKRSRGLESKARAAIFSETLLVSRSV